MFKKKETLVQNMTFMAIMASINAVLSLISCINGAVGFLSTFAIIILPVLSSLVTIFCRKKYYILYSFVTFLTCFISTYFLDPTFSIFAVFPSLVTGFIFGFLIEKKIDPFYSILLCALTQFILNVVTIPIINLITENNMINIFLKVFMLDSKRDLGVQILPSFILVISFIEIILSYIVVDQCLSKIEITSTSNEIKINNFYFDLVFGVLLLGTLILSLINNFKIALLFFLLSFYPYLYSVENSIINSKKLETFLYIFFLILGVIILISFYKIVAKPFGLFLITTGLICSFIYKLILDIIKNVKIKSYN